MGDGMTKAVDEVTILDVLAAGGSLVRVTSSKAGPSWHLGPENTLVDATVAEAVALRADVCCLDGPVGRMVWEYVLTERRDEALSQRLHQRAVARADYDGESGPCKRKPVVDAGG